MNGHILRPPPREVRVHWPDEHVAWQGIIDADPNMSVPFAVHVFIFHTVEQLRAACGNPEANAHSTTWDEPDALNVGATVFLSTEDLHLSLVAHEVAHIALNYHGHNERTRIGARRWLTEHPEQIAEMIGNLTAYIWYGIPEL